MPFNPEFPLFAHTPDPIQGGDSMVNTAIRIHRLDHLLVNTSVALLQRRERGLTPDVEQINILKIELGEAQNNVRESNAFLPKDLQEEHVFKKIE